MWQRETEKHCQQMDPEGSLASQPKQWASCSRRHLVLNIIRWRVIEQDCRCNALTSVCAQRDTSTHTLLYMQHTSTPSFPTSITNIQLSDWSKNGIENMCFTYIKIQQWCVHKEHINNNAFLLGKKRGTNESMQTPHSYNKNDEDRIIRSQKQYEIIL